MGVPARSHGTKTTLGRLTHWRRGETMDSRVAHVSIVIVTWNSAAVLPQCLADLRRHPPSLPHEVIVVDNGSSDATPNLIRELGPPVRVIINDTNRGLPAANNQGMRAAHGDAFLIMNPDALVHAGAIDALVDVMDRRRRAAFGIPRLEHGDGTLQTSAGDLPSLAEALAGRQAQRRRRADRDGPPRGFWWDGWAHDVERRIGRGHEACYLVRGAAVTEIGPQDERFPLDWEGIDWMSSADAAGWETWFAPAAQVTHLGGASIRQVPLRWLVSSHRGMYRYFAKRSSPARRPVLGALFTARALAKAAGMAVRLASYERGHRAGRPDGGPGIRPNKDAT
ncbi:glycosyltransferase family 2 protein [soil metagenome]